MSCKKEEKIQNKKEESRDEAAEKLAKIFIPQLKFNKEKPKNK